MFIDEMIRTERTFCVAVACRRTAPLSQPLFLYLVFFCVVCGVFFCFFLKPLSLSLWCYTSRCGASRSVRTFAVVMVTGKKEPTARERWKSRHERGSVDK